MARQRRSPQYDEGYHKAKLRIERCRNLGECRLDLSYLSLFALPPEIGELKQLTFLSLFGNRLTVLPPEIEKLTALTKLYFGHNRLTTIPREILQLTSLTCLYVDENHLASVPDDIYRLTALRTLSLSSNRLKVLPAEIGKLAHLRELSLYKNKLETLPPEIGRLRELVGLYIDDNSLTSLPPQIGELSSLEKLHLHDNQLTSLPIEMGRLTALTEIYLHDNPSLGIPASILGPTYEDVKVLSPGTVPVRPTDVLNFYFSRAAAVAAAQHQPLNEIKLMLVGDGGAGKTSLRKFFVGKHHSEDEEETLGIALDKFTLRCGSADITVRLWDFAGQEITHALHQFFLTEGCIYIVVVEPRSDSEQSDAEKWLKLIRRYAGNVRTIVALNKQDIRQPTGYDIDRNLLRERFPFLLDFQPTSCGAKRTGCDELLEMIRVHVSNMSEATLPVPKSWICVKDECFEAGKEGREKHYLSLDEFRTLCARHGESAPAKQESLARILHQLGAVLHFVDEPRLRDTTVLNPHWVTDGAYRLLRCKDGPKSDGVLTLSEAVAAIPGGDEQAARYLLGLMERFEMCFSVERSEGEAAPTERWLVPGALDKNQPDQVRADNWNAPNRIRLQFVYEPLPQGLIPRFIVMTHQLSEGRPRWRNGVEVVDGGAKALLRKGPSDNMIEVTIQGPNPDREKRAKVVRGFLSRIHADLPEPKPREFQELSMLPNEFREVRQMKAEERNRNPIIVATEVRDVRRNATDELNRISAERPRVSRKRPLRVFLSYSHDDRSKQQIFRKNLMALENDGYITFWDDPHIRPDMAWRPEIERELESMDVFIGLLTTSFKTSNFIQRVEFKRAIERRSEMAVRMWLILVDDCRVQGTSFEGIQVLKPGGKPVVQHRNLRAGFDAAEKELHQLVVEHWESLPEVDAQSRRPRGF